GTISGKIDLAFRSGQGDRPSGRLAITDYLLRKRGAKFTLEKPASWEIDQGAFSVTQLGLAGSGEAVRMSLYGKSSGIDGRITGNIDLSILEFLTPVIEDAGGRAAIELSVGGTLISPELQGEILFKGAALTAQGLETPFKNI